MNMTNDTKDMHICQSCAMPLQNKEDFGTEKDGTPSQDYCIYCYKDGAFTSDENLADMIEGCIPHVIDGKPYPDEDTARKAMQESFPKLKRWQ